MKLNATLKKLTVVDGFQVPFREPIYKIEGRCYEKTIYGFYKVKYMRLIHQELYIYNDEDA